MKNIRILAFVIFLIIIVFSPSKGQQIDSVLATIEFIEGSAMVQAYFSEDWLIADEATELLVEYKLKTLENSRVILKLENGSVLRLNEQSRILISMSTIMLLMDSGCVEKHLLTIYVETGEVWFLSNIDSNLRTDVVSIRGTDVIYRVSVMNDDSTEVKLYRGSLNTERSYSMEEGTKIYNGRKKARETGEVFEEPVIWRKDLMPSQKLIITSKGEIAFHGDFSPDDIDEKTEWVEWNMEKDNIK